MKYAIYFERLQYLKELIEKRQAHDPQSLANRLDCSEKTIRNMINNLRSQGLAIEYCRTERRYLMRE